MKKFWKVLLCSLGLCLCLVGCATVPDIKNNEGGIVYNGSAAAMVGDYLYFANSYIANTAIGNSDESYVDNAKKSYLARVNTKNLTAPSKDHSVNGVEKVEEELAGHTNTKIFALGEYVYYSTPKREKTSSGDGSEFQFDRTTFYRSKLNGDNKTKMFTSSNVVSKVEVVSHSGRNFLLILDGGNLVKIELNGDPKAETIASDVTSAELPQTYEKKRVGSKQNSNVNV